MALDLPPAYAAAVYLARDIGVRPVGSRGERRALDWAAGRFAAAGLRVGRERFRVPGHGTSGDAIGVFDTPARCLQIVMGHIDSSDAGAGANDNASGAGTVVALAARLGALRPPCDVWLSVNGAEERFVWGGRTHLGSLALVRRVGRLGRRRDLRFALDLDEVGRGGRFWLRSPVGRPRLGVERVVLRAAARVPVTVRWVRDGAEGNSDHREFQLHGLRAAVVESWEGVDGCRELACDSWRRLDGVSLRRAQRLAEQVVSGQ